MKRKSTLDKLIDKRDEHMTQGTIQTGLYKLDKERKIARFDCYRVCEEEYRAISKAIALARHQFKEKQK